MGKNNTLFKDGEPQNHALSRGTYLYSLHMGVPPRAGVGGGGFSVLVAYPCTKIYRVAVSFTFMGKMKKKREFTPSAKFTNNDIHDRGSYNT